MLTVIGNALNVSVDTASGGGCSGHCDCCRDKGAEPFIFVGWLPVAISQLYNFCEYTRSYANFHIFENFNVLSINTISTTSRYLVSFYILLLLYYS